MIFADIRRARLSWLSTHVSAMYTQSCSQQAQLGLLTGLRMAACAPCRSGIWGVHVTLQAAADFLNIKIGLFTSKPQQTFIVFRPNKGQHKRQPACCSLWGQLALPSTMLLCLFW